MFFDEPSYGDMISVRWRCEGELRAYLYLGRGRPNDECVHDMNMLVLAADIRELRFSDPEYTPYEFHVIGVLDDPLVQ